MLADVSTMHPAKGTRMKVTPKIASVAVAVLALGGAGIGTAVASTASTHAPARAVQSEPTRPDTDAIQQGDQTSPDNAAVAATQGAHSSKADNPGEENGSESENGPSDGPGGHADPSGTVQHEFNGVE
jgi:hypothetical protein